VAGSSWAAAEVTVMSNEARRAIRIVFSRRLYDRFEASVRPKVRAAMPKIEDSIEKSTGLE
jgi:hypothetical protein